jgi:hypothetical protein
VTTLCCSPPALLENRDVASIAIEQQDRFADIVWPPASHCGGVRIDGRCDAALSHPRCFATYAIGRSLWTEYMPWGPKWAPMEKKMMLINGTLLQWHRSGLIKKLSADLGLLPVINALTSFSFDPATRCTHSRIVGVDAAVARPPHAPAADWHDRVHDHLSEKTPQHQPQPLGERQPRQEKAGQRACPSMPYSDVKVANRRIVMLGFGAGRQKMTLERWSNPKLSRLTCSPRYGLKLCKGKSAGVAKRPRELID